ncbi:MAG TPA: hypothetical protein VM840_12610 [Actinomycetota bacterium]|nr:hypothetical protein [Actinomycetota bacterium]
MIGPALLATLVLLSMAVPAVAGHREPPPPPEVDRLYLLGAATDYLYWGSDPDDPELDQRSIVRRCGESWGIPGRSKPCLHGSSVSGESSYGIFFFPATKLEGEGRWPYGSPLRFHLELDVSSFRPYTVHLFIQHDSALIESPPAREAAPGVYEGTIDDIGGFRPDQVTLLGVRVITDSPQVTMELGARGASYVDLPGPLPARNVPQLRAEDTHAPAPSSFRTTARAFTFNDEHWSTWSFEGDTRQTRTFELDMEEDAVAIVAWAELWHTPLVHDAFRGRPLDVSKLTDGAGLSVRREGEDVTHTPAAYLTEGGPAVASGRVAAGRLSIEVEPAWQDGDTPYQVHLVAIHGDRTLRSMRWTRAGKSYLRTPLAAGCGAETVPFPVPPEVTTFEVDLDWDSEALTMPGWTLSFDLPTVGWFPCSESGTGDRVRFTVPGPDVWYVGATPAWDRTMVTLEDTVFDYEVRYTHTGPPPPEEDEEEVVEP